MIGRLLPRASSWPAASAAFTGRTYDGTVITCSIRERSCSPGRSRYESERLLDADRGVPLNADRRCLPRPAWPGILSVRACGPLRARACVPRRQVPRADQDLRQRHRRACHIPPDTTSPYDGVRAPSFRNRLRTPVGKFSEAALRGRADPTSLAWMTCHVSSLRLVGLLPAGLSTRLSTSEGKRRDRNAIIVASLLRRGQTLCVARLPTCAVAKIAPV